MGCVWWMTRASRAEVALGQQILLFSEVLERKARGNATAGSPLQITGLDQVRFVHVLHGLAFFAYGRGQGVHAHRSSSEFLDDGEQQLAIHLVKARRVHADPGQSRVGDFPGHAPVEFDLCVVAHTAEQAVGDARRAAGTARDLGRAVFLDRHLQDARRPQDDGLQLLRGEVSDPARVVAPIRVNRGRSSLIVRVDGPCPMMRSSWKSSIAGYSASSTGAGRRWISSMNRISPSCNVVRMAARSPAWLSTMPDVERMATPISRAMMWA